MIKEERFKQAALNALESLSQEGKASVFEKLDSDSQIKITQGVLSRMTPKEIRSILNQLKIDRRGSEKPEPRTRIFKARRDFAEYYSGKHCSVEKRSTNFGNEVRLTCLPGSTIEMVMEEINARSQEQYGRSAIDTAKYFSSHEKLREVISKRTSITFISVLKSSSYLPIVGPEDCDFPDVLKKYGFDFVDPLYLAVAAGALRVAKGFPPQRGKDKGALFEGWDVKSSSGVVLEREEGIREVNYYSSRGLIVAVAALTSMKVDQE